MFPDARVKGSLRVGDVDNQIAVRPGVVWSSSRRSFAQSDRTILNVLMAVYDEDVEVCVNVWSIWAIKVKTVSLHAWFHSCNIPSLPTRAWSGERKGLNTYV